MLKNYFKIAIRNLLKNKGYSTINILGLTLGITCCLVLLIVVRFELSFDNFHPKGDRIYRVVTGFERKDGWSYNQGAPFPLHEALKNDLSDLDQVVLIDYFLEGDVIVSKGEKEKYKEQHIGYVNQEYFSMFQHVWLAGNKTNALSEPNQVVISKELATKYFKDPGEALGEVIRLDNKYDLKVTGVIERFPENSDFRFNMLVSFLTVKPELEKDGEWGSVSSSMQHFVLLPENTHTSDFDQRVAELADKYVDQSGVAKTLFSLQPLETIHFDTRYGNFSNRVSGKETVWALTAIGIFMIITACINFINLATAQAVKRSKEVGIRKVLGSNKLQLTFQFLGETAIISVIAILISIVLVDAVLPSINQIMGLNLSFHPFQDIEVAFFLLLLLVVVTVLSGYYPSVVLSGFKPVEAIKNKINVRHAGGYTLRRGLVVFQFVISQVLIIGTIIVSSQLSYFKNTNLGFNQEAILTVPLPENDQASLARFNQALQEITSIKSMTFGYSSPSSDNRWTSSVEMMGSEMEEVQTDIKLADVRYPQTYEIELLAGRFYGESDTIREVVVNEAFIRKFGIEDPNDALGREVEFWNDFPVPIVGVVKDFHAVSLRDDLGPLLLSTDLESYEEAGLKISPQNVSETLKEIEAAWTAVYPSYVFDYQFLDERIGEFYLREARLNQLFQIFAGIAIFIGCLGLYGLVSFMAQQKTKEVGIRKVLGASVANILLLFSKEFTTLVMIAFVIASPIAYFIMNSWLENYTYRIEIGLGVFLLAVASSLFIAWITVGFKALKASVANPIDSLKSD